MKQVTTTILLLLLTTSVASWAKVVVYVSDNNEFQLQVNYQPDSAICTLTDSIEKTLWSRKVAIRNATPPRVSNSGIVAFPRFDDVMFIFPNGETSFTKTINNDSLIGYRCRDCGYGVFKHNFSADGDQYLLVAIIGERSHLFSFTPKTGEELWRVPIESNGDRLIPFTILAKRNRVIVGDFHPDHWRRTMEELEYQNKCFLINLMDGKILNEYSVNSRPYEYPITWHENHLIIYSSNLLMKYDIVTGDKVGELQLADTKDWLSIGDLEKTKYALYLMRDRFNEFELSESDISRIGTLANSSDGKVSFLSSEVMGKIR